MGHIVHIGQRRGNENITLVVLGEDLMCTLDAIELGLRGRDSDTLRALLVGLLVTKVATLELIEGEEVELLTVFWEEGLHVVVGHDLDRLEVRIVHGMKQAELAILQTTAILGSGEQTGVQLVVEVLDESLEELLFVVVLLQEVLMSGLSQLVVEDVSPVVELDVCCQTGQLLLSILVGLAEDEIADRKLSIEGGVCIELELHIGYA